MIKAVHVPVNKVARVLDFGNIEEIKSFLDIPKDGEWEVCETNTPGIGVVCKDQDEDLPMNYLGIKGDLVILGLEVSTKGNVRKYEFSSLDEEVAREFKLQRSVQILREASGVSDEHSG